MTDMHDTPHVVVQEQGRESDPVVWWLTFGVIFVVVVALVGILYALLGGFLTPSTPRTLIESQLVTLKNAAVTYPKSGAARQSYILALEASGQKDAANAEYVSAIKQVSGLERTPVYAAGVTLLYDAKDYKGAIARAKEAIAADDAARKAMIADALKKATILTNASFDNTARVSILLASARASGAVGDWQTAVKTLSDAIVLDPEGADLLTFRASAYVHLGQKDKAIADYNKALSYIPDYAPALSGLKELQGK